MTQGKCYLCQGIFPKNQMTKHLASCTQKQTADSKSPLQRSFQILAEGKYLPAYWLYLEMPAQTTLKVLDGFLRDIWLECCGHLSAFNVDKNEQNMNTPLYKILETGMKFDYEYDFGSTTHLTIKVMADELCDPKNKSVKLLARNEPPLIKCSECDKPATQVCTECIYDNAGWLCDDCVSDHECGEEMLLPVVNSPRVGVCGYTGD